VIVVRPRAASRPHTLPGFGLALGYTLFYLGVVVLIPLAGLVFKTFTIPWADFRAAVGAPRVMAALGLSFGAALVAAAIDVLLGLLIAWALVRYPFPGRRLADALVDLPFALPTAVAGISLTTLYSPNGWLGGFLNTLGVQIAFTRLGIVIALIFIGLPFVVRVVQPVLQDIEVEQEEVAACLGAGRLQTFLRVILPVLTPALVTGFTLAFARAVGEYGSVIFIAGNLPMVSEIAPLIIVIKREQYDFAGATSVALVMLATAFLLLFAINVVQRRFRKRFWPA